MKNIFTQHPESVGETYGTHAGAAFHFARMLALATLASVVHAVMPFVFTRTASLIVARLYDQMLMHRVRPPDHSDRAGG